MTDEELFERRIEYLMREYGVSRAFAEEHVEREGEEKARRYEMARGRRHAGARP